MTAVRPLPLHREMQVSIETITPNRARELLDSMAAHQRKPSANHVQHLARQIRDGMWMVTGDTIKLDVDQRMFDGQHRCLACIEANRPFDTFVVHSAPHEAFDRVDTGRTRNIQQVLQMVGGVHYNHLAGAIRYRWLEERDLPLNSAPSIKPSNAEAREIFDRYPEMESSAKYGASIGSKFRGVTGACMAYVHFKTHKRAPAQADEFFYLLRYGSESSGPLFTLREHLISYRAKGSSTAAARLDLMQITVVAWNAWRRGKSGRIILRPRSVPAGTLPEIA